MEKNRALLVLGIATDTELNPEAVEEALAEAIFAETRYFMLRAFIPKLAKARIKRLQLLGEAATTFEFQEHFLHIADVKINMDDKDTFLGILEAYHKAEATIKLNLTKAETTQTGVAIYQNWIEIFHLFSKVYLSHFEERFPNTKVNDSIKLSSVIDYVEIKESLEADDNNQLIINLYSRLKKCLD